jgi:hypothetical protein
VLCHLRCARRAVSALSRPTVWQASKPFEPRVIQIQWLVVPYPTMLSPERSDLVHASKVARLPPHNGAEIGRFIKTALPDVSRSQDFLRVENDVFEPKNYLEDAPFIGSFDVTSNDTLQLRNCSLVVYTRDTKVLCYLQSFQL